MLETWYRYDADAAFAVCRFFALFGMALALVTLGLRMSEAPAAWSWWAELAAWISMTVAGLALLHAMRCDARANQARREYEL